MDSIEQWSSAYGVDKALTMAVITVESDGDPNSLSSAGAMGLMQLMPETCSDYGVEDPFNPNSNIRGGTAMLANHFRRYRGDLQKVLAAYNAGIRHADDGSWARIPETRRYVPTVIAYFEALKGSSDLSGFADSLKIPTLPPERDIDATPVIPTMDLMFQALRWSPNIADPAGLYENSGLDDSASLLLNWYQAGLLNDANLQKLAMKAAKANHLRTGTLEAVCLITHDLDGFQSKWNQQPKLKGNGVGLAHGLTRQGHVWIILVATLR